MRVFKDLFGKRKPILPVDVDSAFEISLLKLLSLEDRKISELTITIGVGLVPTIEITELSPTGEKVTDTYSIESKVQ